MTTTVNYRYFKGKQQVLSIKLLKVQLYKTYICAHRNSIDLSDYFIHQLMCVVRPESGGGAAKVIQVMTLASRLHQGQCILGHCHRMIFISQ